MILILVLLYLIIKAYLQRYMGDKMIDETLIRHEIYSPQRAVVIEGCEDLPAGIEPIDSGVRIVYE